MTDRVEFINDTLHRLAANDRNDRATVGIPEPRIPTVKERAESEWQAGAADRQMYAEFVATFAGERTPGPPRAPVYTWRWGSIRRNNIDFDTEWLIDILLSAGHLEHILTRAKAQGLISDFANTPAAATSR